MTKYVAYFRVSTAGQGVSGLGLESQKTIVNNFVKSEDIIIADYTEVESGKNDKRVQLDRAIKFAQTNNATLLIAKLDRLSRNASFIFALRDSGIKFICCDMPDATHLTIGIFALLAQQERELTSIRTKLALAEKKKQGFKLGKPENLTDYSRAKSIEVRRTNADNNENTIRALSLIKALRSNNNSYAKIADELNNSGFKTATNKTFFPMTVKQLLDSNC